MGFSESKWFFFLFAAQRNFFRDIILFLQKLDFSFIKCLNSEQFPAHIRDRILFSIYTKFADRKEKNHSTPPHPS